MESITLSNELPESYLNEGMLFCEMGVKCGSLNSGNLILEYIGLLMVPHSTTGYIFGGLAFLNLSFFICKVTIIMPAYKD